MEIKTDSQPIKRPTTHDKGIKIITINIPNSNYDSFREYCKSKAINHKIIIEQLVNTFILKEIKKDN